MDIDSPRAPGLSWVSEMDTKAGGPYVVFQPTPPDLFRIQSSGIVWSVPSLISWGLSDLRHAGGATLQTSRVANSPCGRPLEGPSLRPRSQGRAKCRTSGRRRPRDKQSTNGNGITAYGRFFSGETARHPWQTPPPSRVFLCRSSESFAQRGGAGREESLLNG